MSECYIGEIRVVSFNYPPKNWAFCNGQTMSIAQNQALFSLLGTRFGGNGMTTFNLPDLRGRMPMGMGAGHIAGETGGEEAHSLTNAEMPQHVHTLNANTALATAMNPANALPGKKGRLGRDVYAAPANLTSLHGASVSTVGGSQPHPNMQPFLGINFVIALYGIYPSRS